MKTVCIFLIVALLLLAGCNSVDLPNVIGLHGTYLNPTDADDATLDRGSFGLSYGRYVSKNIEAGTEVQAILTAPVDVYTAGGVIRYYRPISDVNGVPIIGNLVDWLPGELQYYVGAFGGYGMFDIDGDEDYGAYGGPLFGLMATLSQSESDKVEAGVEYRRGYYDDRTGGDLAFLQNSDDILINLRYRW